MKWCAVPWVLSICAVGLSLGAMHKERKTRHQVEMLRKERAGVLKQHEDLCESFEVLTYDIEGVRDRVEALWVQMEKPKGAASPETARR
jgi:hypothetical protein